MFSVPGRLVSVSVIGAALALSIYGAIERVPDDGYWPNFAIVWIYTGVVLVAVAVIDGILTGYFKAVVKLAHRLFPD